MYIPQSQVPEGITKLANGLIPLAWAVRTAGDPLALRAADIHEERTRLALQRLVALLVPAITVLMGAAVAGIVSSLMLAMLSLNDIAQ